MEQDNLTNNNPAQPTQEQVKPNSAVPSLKVRPDIFRQIKKGLQQAVAEPPVVQETTAEPVVADSAPTQTEATEQKQDAVVPTQDTTQVVAEVPKEPVVVPNVEPQAVTVPASEQTDGEVVNLDELIPVVEVTRTTQTTTGGAPEQPTIEFVNNKLNTKFESFEQFNKTFNDMQNALHALIEEKEKTDAMIGSKALKDPAVQEIITMIEGGAGLDDVIDGLNMLKVDYGKRGQDGKHVMSDRDVLFQYYKKEFPSASDEAIETELAVMTELQMAQQAKMAREKFNKERETKLARWKRLKESAKAQADVIDNEDPEKKFAEAYKQAVEKIKEPIKKVKEINGKNVEKLTSFVFDTIENDPQWMSKIIYNEQGEIKPEVVIEMFVRFHNSMNPKVKDVLFGQPKQDVSVLRKQWEADYLKTMMNKQPMQAAAPQSAEEKNTDNIQTVAQRIFSKGGPIKLKIGQ